MGSLKFMGSLINNITPTIRSRVLSWDICVRVAELLSCVLVLWVVTTGSVARADSQLAVEYSEWGFDDRGVPRKFNLLTLEIQNSSGQPYEGTLRLRRLMGATPVGVDLVKPFFLGPFQKRMVQFTPYVFDSSDEWEVVWGDTLDDKFLVERARLGIGSRVIFNAPAGGTGLASGLRGFREDRFPSSLIGTDTLQCVVMDHAPQWEAARKKAFRDWLYQGGALHVLYGPDGRFPELPVGELNSPERRERYGTGRIYWHEIQRRHLHDNRQYVYSKIYSTARVSVPINRSGAARTDLASMDPTSMEYTSPGAGVSDMDTYAEWDSDAEIPITLREFIQSRTRHDWPLIYFLGAVYVLLIFPGGPFLARRLDYRLNLLALVVVVSGWSWLYSMVGARGFGESTSTQSLAIARPLPEGRWDIEQWSGVFVTDGDTYPLTHQGETRHYSGLVKDAERVRGFSGDGKNGQFAVDIPPFTSRTMTHRSVVTMPAPRFEVVSADRENGVLLEVSLRMKGEFPTQVHSAVLIVEGTVYSVNPSALGGVSTLKLTSPIPSESLLDYPQQRFQSRFESRRRNPLSETQAFDDMFRLVLARDIGIRTISDRTRFRLPRDILRLCVYADLPDELVCRDGRHPDRMMGRNIGRVLYSIDLPYTPPELPEKEPQTDSSSSDNPQERRPVDRGTQ